MTERSHLRTIPPSRARSAEGRCPTGIARCAPPRRGWPPPCPTRTARSSPCPTRARSNGISRTPAGSSRPSLLDAALPGYRPFDPAFRMLFNSYYNAVGDKHPRPAAGSAFRGRRAHDIVAYRAHVDEAMQRLLARHDGGNAELAALVELGLQHEQQHQELILTDVLHMLSCNPLASPRTSRSPVATAAPRATRPRRPGSSSRADWPRSDTTAPVSRSTTKCRATRVSGRPSRWPSRPVTQRRIPGIHRRRRLPAARAVALRRLGLASTPAELGRAALLASATAADGRRFTLRGTVADRRCDAPVCHVSLFEADAYARWAGARLADRGRMGGGRRGALRSRATSSKAARCIRGASRSAAARTRSRRCSATSGSGRKATMRPIRGFEPAPAPSASTTASSCATSTCCAAAPASRRVRTSARLTATFSPPLRAGSFRHSPGAGFELASADLRRFRTTLSRHRRRR